MDEGGKSVKRCRAVCPVCGFRTCSPIGRPKTLLQFGLTYSRHRCCGCGHEFDHARKATIMDVLSARASVLPVRRPAYWNIETEEEECRGE